MPIIREYNQQLNAPIHPIGPSASPQAAALRGKAAAEFGAAVSSVGKDIFDIAEQHDMTQLQVETAQARADFTAKMQQAKESGEAADPEYVRYATEAAQEKAAQLAEKMGTRRGTEAARAYGAQFSAAMQTQAIHDNAAAIGEQAKLTALETQNINRNTLASSPQQFVAILGETRQHIDSLTNIDAGVRRRMLIEAQDGLATAAIQGVIRTRSPEEAKQILDDRHFDGFLSADSKRGLYAEVEQTIRSREAEAMRLERQQKLLEEKEFQEIGKTFIAKMHTPNGNQLSITKDILPSKLPWQMKEHFINEIKSGPAKVDNGLVNRLFQDMYREEGDPRKITSAGQLVKHVGRGLDLTAYDHLARELDKVPLNKDVGRAMEAARFAFRSSPVGRAIPDAAELAALDWSRDLRAAIDQYRAEGKDPAKLMSRDPTDKESFLYPPKMAGYLKSSNMLVAEKVSAVEGTQANPVVVKDKAGYDALPSGAHYVDPEGKLKVKR